METASKELDKAWNKVLELDAALSKEKQKVQKLEVAMIDYRLQVLHQLEILQKIVRG